MRTVKLLALTLLGGLAIEAPAQRDLQCLERAAVLRPDFAPSNTLLGATLFLLGEDEEAYKALYHAHQLNPADDYTNMLLLKEARILAVQARNRKQYQQSMEYFECALMLRPDDAALHEMLSDPQMMLI